jgi:hypothetical protein
MAGTVSMQVDAETVIAAVKRMSRRDREAFLEDLLAATSPEYLESVRDARRQYRAGKVKSHFEVFGR